MTKSMTGFGAATAAVDTGTLTVELRSVNHRFLDVRTRVPPELSEHAPAAEVIVRERLVRGRVEIGVRLSQSARSAPQLDVARARAVLSQLAALRDEISPGEPLPLSILAAVPDLFCPAAPPDPAHLADALSAATRGACDALDAMREREGAALRCDLDERLSNIDGIVARIRSACASVAETQRTRLRERIARLLDDVEVTLDQGRLEHEIAICADRADVSEELTRLSSHCGQFRELLRSEGAVGRKLDFLLQEVNREVNTIGSKSADTTIAREVIELKAEVERIREQVQNVL